MKHSTDATKRELIRTSRRTAIRTGLAGLALSSIPLASAAPKHGNEGSNSNRVTGVYKATYAYDANGDWYGYNLSNTGATGGTVASIAELDQETLTTCDYKIQYQGSFGDDPYLDMGWIRNNVVCKGYEPDNRNVLFVSEEDTRYTGEGTPIWGSWEYFVDSQRGTGNVLITDDVRPAQSD